MAKGLLQSSEPNLSSPQGDTHPKTAALTSHDKNRDKCCLVCWRWTKMALNDSLKDGIKNLFSVNFDYTDRRIPLGICNTCRRGLYDYNKSKVNSKNLELVHRTFDFINIPPSTRSELVCSCKICLVAKGPVKVGNFKKFSGPARKLETIPENTNPTPGPAPSTVPKVIPSTSGAISKVQKNPDDLLKCGKCLNPLGKGIPHNCTQKSLADNLQKICDKNPSVGQKVAAKTLRSKEPSPGGRVHLELGAGRSKLAVAVNAPPACKKTPVNAEEDVTKFCLELGLGIGKQMEFSTQMNKWFGPGTIQTGFQKALREMSRTVSGKCHVTQLEFQVKGAANLVSLPIWAVNDLDEYVTFLHEKRNLHFSQTKILLGIDMGQKFLKTTLQVIDVEQEESDEKVSKKGEKFKSTGVRKLHFAAICDHQVPESHFNTKVILDHIQAHKVKYTFVSDLMEQNKFHGKQPHSCDHPCHICPAPKSDFLSVYPLSTYESCVRDYERWQSESGKRKDLNQYHNQEFKPIGVEHMTEVELKEYILLNAPCPPVHLILSTNTLVDIGENLWGWGIKEWLKLSMVGYKNYFGGTLEGNQCSTLLDNYGILDNLARKHGRLDMSSFIRVVKALCGIKKACFGAKLDPNFESICDEFRDSLVAFEEFCNTKF